MNTNEPLTDSTHPGLGTLRTVSWLPSCIHMLSYLYSCDQWRGAMGHPATAVGQYPTCNSKVRAGSGPRHSGEPPLHIIIINRLAWHHWVVTSEVLDNKVLRVAGQVNAKSPTGQTADTKTQLAHESTRGLVKSLTVKSAPDDKVKSASSYLRKCV